MLDDATDRRCMKCNRCHARASGGDLEDKCEIYDFTPRCRVQRVKASLHAVLNGTRTWRTVVRATNVTSNYIVCCLAALTYSFHLKHNIVLENVLYLLVYFCA
jgi:phage FluMu protein Com